MSVQLFTRVDDVDQTVLRIFGKLDVITANDLKPVFDELVTERPHKIVVDLGGLDLIDSSGVAAIVGLYKRVRAAGGEVRVTGARDQPLTIFKLLRMDRVFNL